MNTENPTDSLLTVPSTARAVFAEHHRLPPPNSSAVDWGEVDRDVRAFSRPVVAAELRRIAEEADRFRMEWTPVGNDPARAAAVRAYAKLRDLLAARADELDPA